MVGYSSMAASASVPGRSPADSRTRYRHNFDQSDVGHAIIVLLASSEKKGRGWNSMARRNVS